MDPLVILDDDVINYSDVNIPDITSADKDERKAARRIRIQKRNQLLQGQRASIFEDSKSDKPTLLQQQLEKSSEILKQLFMEVEEQVTNIRVANDAREVERRENDEITRVNILNQLEKEARLAGSMFELISSKWINILKYNDPLHIHEEILAQKEKCDEIIKQKDAVIAMLRNQLKMAELTYTNDQTTQIEDIKMLARRVEQQVITMRTAHANELQNIEDVMIQERMNMMTNNDKRWEDLYRKRWEQEMAISQHKLQQKADFQDKVAKVRIVHYERIREVKIRMERDCEALQQEFERIKAIALENCEKIDYNYQILKKREDENLIIKSNQKRKLNKLRDIINHLRRKHDTYKETTDAELNKMLNEILALQKSISNVKNKCATLTAANDSRYLQVWDLNKRDASNLLTKLLTIDKILHEQQLGLHWEEPAIKLIRRSNLVSYNEAIRTMDALKGQNYSLKVESDENYKAVYNAAYKHIMLAILEKISERSSFIMEKSLKQILEPCSKKEIDLIQIQNVFDALNISNIVELKILYQYFRPYIKCPICTASKITTLDSKVDDTSSIETSTYMAETIKSENQGAINFLQAVHETDSVVDGIVTKLVDPARMKILEEGTEFIYDEGECLGPKTSEVVHEKKAIQIKDDGTRVQQDSSRTCLNTHPLYIEAPHILKGFKEFVSNYYCVDKEDKKNENSDFVANPTISRMLTESDVESYWDSYKQVFGQNKVDLWDSLLFAMQKYHAILEDRHNLHNTLQSVRKQNMELKHLLKRYRKDENIKPPCAISNASRIMSYRSVGTKK